MKKPLGQSLTEYGLIMGLVAMLCLPALFLLKDAMGSSIEAMLPSAKANNPVLTKLPANGNMLNPAPGAPVGNGEGNIDVVTGAGSNASALAAEPISTAGSNGNSATVLGNSAKIQAIAAKYSQTAPELSNSIVKLGQLGQQMGQAIANQDKTAANQIWGNFTDLYTQVLMNSGAYGQLSPEDQGAIKTLTNQSSQLTADFAGIKYAGHASLGDYDGTSPKTAATEGALAEQVQSNSNQTVRCGRNLSCN